MMTGRSDSGVSLISVLLLLMLASAMLVAVTSLTSTDATLRGVDQTETQAFYAASGALEKMTSDLGNIFQTNYAPTAAQINALMNNPPVLPNVRFDDGNGTNLYRIGGFVVGANGRPTTQSGEVKPPSPFAGMKAILTSYNMDVTAQVLSAGSVAGEVELRREMQTVAIPVFQFGIFSQTDLAFHPGSDFDFGGRVHTNGNLFLAAGTGPPLYTLYLKDKVTAAGDVIRWNIENGWLVGGAGLYNGNVMMATGAGAQTAVPPPTGFRALANTEGSQVNGVGSGVNPAWQNLSGTTYGGYILNGATGARVLTLPFATLGAREIDLIRRGIPGENPLVTQQRYYAQASLRILLSDLPNELTASNAAGNPGLPGLTATPPQRLTVAGGLATAAQADASMIVGGVPRFVYRSAAGTDLLDGYIKIEMQLPLAGGGGWQDVTAQILGYGFSGRNQGVPGCGDPSPNAIIRIQRVRNVPAAPGADPCGQVAPNVYTNLATDYWPNVLYDAREGLRRENGAAITASDSLFLSGVMHYIELDVRNLSQWFKGIGPYAGGSGANSERTTGLTVYFSDRRGNKTGPAGETVGQAGQPNLLGQPNRETGRFGSEDFQNTGTAYPTGSGGGNLALEQGEDVNGNGVLDRYGESPSLNGVLKGAGALLDPAAPAGIGATAPLNDANSLPWTDLSAPVHYAAIPLANKPTGAQVAQANRAVLFRRALKLVNGWSGSIISIGAMAGDPGLTVVAENPIYVQGDWNAATPGGPVPPPALPGFPAEVATSVIGDSITLLSNSWNDVNSFTLPNNAMARPASNTSYQMAVLGGKGRAFPNAGVSADFGVDGGADNFMHLLEDWKAGAFPGRTLTYVGSIASFFYSQQSTGIFKCCTNVYRAPGVRAFSFDIQFLDTNKLPPLTPMFRDVNSTGFQQVITR